MENDDKSASLLVTILDVNQSWWRAHDAKTKPEESFLHCLESVMVFINSHLLLNHTNKLGLIVCHNKQSKFVYPNEENNNTNESSLRDGKYEVFIKLDDCVVDEVKQIYNDISREASPEDDSTSLLAGAMSQALCFINRVAKDHPASARLNSRILVIKGTDDVPALYMSIMSCIFAAQKNDVIIDGCVLGGDSGYLQQAADITGGNYLKAGSISGLLQYLLWVFLPDPETRKSLVLPASSQIDYRGACFCHRALVDVGFVCSVCLSIYCKFIPRCMTCQTHFKLPALPMGGKAKKKKKN